MRNQLTRRDFAIRSAGFGLALGLAPAATLAEAEQADGLPPAWIGVGSIDLLVEEDVEYARRLVRVRGAFHGFDLLLPDAEASKQFGASWKSASGKAFATGKAV